MQLRIHLPPTDERPKKCGFRYCNKDKRWEKNGRFNISDAQAVASEVGEPVHLVIHDTSATINP